MPWTRRDWPRRIAGECFHDPGAVRPDDSDGERLSENVTASRQSDGRLCRRFRSGAASLELGGIRVSGVRLADRCITSRRAAPGYVGGPVESWATYIATVRVLAREGLVNRELLDVRGSLQPGAGGGHRSSDPRFERVEVLA